MDTIFQLDIMAGQMNILLNKMCKKIKNNSYSIEVITNIKLLRNTLDNLNCRMKLILSKYPESILLENLEELTKYFKEISCSIELNDGNSIEELFINYITPLFIKFYNELDRYFFKITGVKKVIVIGINELLPKIEELIDSKKCRIIALISDDSEIQEDYINEIPIFTISEISYINYDYLIISDDFKWSSEEKNVLNIHEYIECFYDYETFRVYDTYINSENPIDGLITGLSYAEVGIDTSQLSYDVINAAVSSQDLFFDYQWAKMIINNEKIGNNVKFAIIGFSYFSFEYDLSKSHLKDRIFKYYSFFKESRNHPRAEEIISKYNKFEQVALSILKEDYNILLFNVYFKEEIKSWWDNLQTQVMNQAENEKIAKEIKLLVEKDCNKDYPETVQENTEILQEYILFLKSKNITPIIVVCPTCQEYYKNFSTRLKEECRRIINNIKDEFDVEVFDCFESNVFSDEDFYNVSHLNKNGAKKFTKLLNDKLVNMKI